MIFCKCAVNAACHFGGLIYGICCLLSGNDLTKQKTGQVGVLLLESVHSRWRHREEHNTGSLVLCFFMCLCLERVLSGNQGMTLLAELLVQSSYLTVQ